MSIRLGKSIESLTAVRRIGQTSQELGLSFERLSSGQRIYMASADAAGLAIADSLGADSRDYNQSVRNASEASPFLASTEGALKQLKAVVPSIKELAEQPANGVYSPPQRGALNAEAQSLASEYNRIIDATSLNGQREFRRVVTWWVSRLSESYRPSR